MPITVQVRYEDQQPGGGLIVRVYQFPKAGRATAENATLIAEGKSRANGIWLFQAEEFDPSRRVSLAIIDPETDKVLHRSRPVRLGNIPDAVKVEVSRTPSIDAPDIDDLKPDPVAPGTVSDVQSEEKDTSGPRRRGYTDMLRERLTRADQVKDAEDAIIGERALQSFARRRKGKEFADRFLGKKPRTAPPGTHFVPKGSAGGREEDVIKEASDRYSRPHGRGLVLRPGPLADKVPPAGGTIPQEELQAVLSACFSGPAAQVRQTPLDMCRAMKAAAEVEKQLKGEDKTDAGVRADTTPAAPADASGNDQHPVDQIVERMLGTVNGGVGRGRPGLSDVAAGLDVDVPLGPADVTSYYDFNTLKVAWQDSWTGLVDMKLAGDVKELYDRVVRTVPRQIDQDALDQEMSEIEDLHELLDTLADVAGAVNSNITTDSQLAGWIPEISEKWSDLTPFERDKLSFLYDVHVYVHDYQFVTIVSPATFKPVDIPNNKKLSETTKFKDYPSDWLPSDLTVYAAAETDWAETEAHEILSQIAPTEGARIGRVDGLISSLKTKIAKPYQFDVFLPGSYNYGILTTYRQQWTPITYQPGDLAGTITLAPNERRKYTVTRKSTSKDTRSSSVSTSDQMSSESATTARSEGEIMRRTQSAMNTTANAEVGFNMGISFSGGGSFGFDQGSESAQTKSDLREETRKSAQEYRDERKTEITTETTSETGYTEEREITNPNSELTVTYLFYELQRRFRVRERLHHVRPVVMVAFSVPEPHVIDESWLLEHEWILRKVLLDRTLHGTLRLLSQDFAGDELATEIYEEQWKTQIALVSQLGDQLAGHTGMRDAARMAIQEAADRARMVASADDDGTTWQDVGMVLSGGVGVLLADRLFKKITDDTDENLPSEADSAQQALDWATADQETAQAAMQRGVAALDVATERYVTAVRDRLNRRVEIDKLILHVKSNILHYMQAIWMHEHADQRYLRLYDKSVIWPGFDGPAKVKNASMVAPFPMVPGGIAGKKFKPEGLVELPPVGFRDRRRLHEVADLSRILGFKGNYAIFALNESNALTTSMAQDFLDTELGLYDPDEEGNLPTAEEAIELARCAWDLPETTEADREEITEWLLQALAVAHRISQEIVVPSGELFIEALPGAHPLLEDFKLTHRAHDMAKAAAEARKAELEVLRRAERLKAGDMSDPDIDKRVEILGGASSVNLDVDGS